MSSLYLHIPFCEHKCLYCDFYSIETMEPMKPFLEALHAEIDLYGSLGEGFTFDTVFFGGGTPSLLTPMQLESILSHLRNTFEVDPDAEITLETNPGTVDKAKLSAFRSLGVNRLSVGVQSFNAAELEFLTRIHSGGDAIRCVEDARSVGFENISIDLIYALPDQTREGWKKNIATALELDTQHISAYGLIVEQGTPLARMVQSGQIAPAPAESEAEFYELTMQVFADEGYEQYEVSNYAKPGYRSRHNYNYWTHGNYLGFGPSAHSFWHNDEGSRRWCNISHLSHYGHELRQKKLPLVVHDMISNENLETERIFLGLRSDGIDLRRFQSEFHKDFLLSRRQIVDDLVAHGLAVLEKESLRLTRKGYLLCDEICARLIA